MLGAYEFLASVVGAVSFPFLFLRAALGSDVWRDRLALSPSAIPALSSSPLWCHAASLGEMESLLPVIEEIRARRPRLPLVVSATTPTGRDLARARLADESPFLLPLDVPWIMRRVMDRIRPLGVVLAETELWPSLVAAARRRRVPLAMVNGRISAGGFRRYSLVRPLAGEMLREFSLLAMQSEEDRDRVVALGARKEVVHVTGNAKADARGSVWTTEEKRRGRREWGIPEGVPLVVAGSVRPAEETAVLDGFVAARREQKGLRLLLAPRHLDRIDELEREIDARELSWRRRSGNGVTRPSGEATDWDVLLIDTMGELADAYALGEVAFVGGTLDERYGGHNPLEPAARGIPVLMGPHFKSCEESARRLLDAGGGLIVRNSNELAGRANHWLNDAGERRRAGEAAVRAAGALRGVAGKVADLLERGILES